MLPRLSPSCRYWQMPIASAFLESLMETELYSIGAFFCDEHPDLVDEVVDAQRGDRAQRPRGLRGRARGPARGDLRDPADRASRSATTRRSRVERPRLARGCPASCWGSASVAVMRWPWSRSPSARVGPTRPRPRASARPSSSSAASTQEGAHAGLAEDAPVLVKVFNDLLCVPCAQLPERGDRPGDRALRAQRRRRSSSSATSRSAREPTSWRPSPPTRPASRAASGSTSTS